MSKLTQRATKNFRTQRELRTMYLTIREFKIRCYSRENLEFEGAKSSFQKGLGPKSRFLKMSKILSFWGLKPTLDIRFSSLSSQRWSGNSKTSLLVTFEKINFFTPCWPTGGAKMVIFSGLKLISRSSYQDGSEI